MNQEKRNWLDSTPFPSLPWLNAEVLFFSLIVLLAVLTRFYDLETRVMSHDESLHTYFSWTFYRGQGYQHNPMMHGPLQFHMLALSYFIFGASDFTARIPAVLFSIATVWALWYWRRYLGRWGVLAAGLMMLVSPYMLYYGRYVRNEAFVALFGLLSFYAILRYLEEGSAKHLYLLTAAMVLHFTVKETSFIYTAQILLFLAALLIAQLTRAAWAKEQSFYGFIISLILSVVAIGIALLLQSAPEPAISVESLTPAANPPYGFIAAALVAVAALAASIYFAWTGYGMEEIRKERSFDLLMLVGTLTLPMLTAFFESIAKKALPSILGNLSLTDYSWPTGILTALAFLLPILAISIALGLWWKKDLWWKAALLHYGIITLFYTSLFTNGVGFFTGVIGSLGYWIEQHGVERGSQPLYYYTLLQVPVYEYLPLLAALFAAVWGIWKWRSAPQEGETKPSLTYALLLWWSFSALIAFSIAGERMPWLTVHITLPFILLGGWGVGAVFNSIRWKELPQQKAAITLALLLTFTLSAAGTLAALFGSPAPFSGTDLTQLQASSNLVFALLGMIASGYGLFRLLQEWDSGQALALLTLTVFGFLLLLTARTSIRANYINYDSGKEYLVYAHGYTGVKTVLEQVMQISERTTGTPYDIIVAYDDDVSWPMSWYLRDFTNARFYGAEPDVSLRDVPVIIVGDNNYAKMEPIVGEDYYRQDYVRMVWPNQDYFNLASERLDPSLPLDPAYSCNGALSVFRLLPQWDFSRLCNALGNPEMTRAIFQIWLNRDYTKYAEITGSQGLVEANWDPSDRMRLYIRKDIADLVWNYGIKAADLEPDPYILGTRNYTADLLIGVTGSENAQFNGPRGIAFAPDGSFYVADSRNHRIQHFSAEGEFINAWGSYGDMATGNAPQGTFNEPWGVAVAPDGSVYVTDTWNHRVQQFSPEGEPVRSWGIFGLASDAPDALYGPRGISVDSQGRVFVADTGNKRIVIFSPQGELLGQFGMEGYEPGFFNEPVDVKLDGQGNVYVTDAWNQRVQVFSESGENSYTPFYQWGVKGWRSQSLENKPFLAISPTGQVFVTDPEGYRVIEFSSNGEFAQLWGAYGIDQASFGLPSGIAVDAAGKVWVTDAANGRVMRFSLP